MNEAGTSGATGAVPFRILYKCIFDQITTGDLPPGFPIPSEPKLAREFGVARATVREALRLLAEDGLLRREVGRGTFVTEPALREVRVAIACPRDLMRTAGLRYGFKRLPRVPLHAAERARLGLDPRTAWGRDDAVHFGDGQAMVFDRRLVACRESVVPVEHRHRVHAAASPHDVAGWLGTDPGEWCLEIHADLVAPGWTGRACRFIRVAKLQLL